MWCTHVLMSVWLLPVHVVLQLKQHVITVLVQYYHSIACTIKTSCCIFSPPHWDLEPSAGTPHRQIQHSQNPLTSQGYWVLEADVRHWSGNVIRRALSWVQWTEGLFILLYYIYVLLSVCMNTSAFFKIEKHNKKAPDRYIIIDSMSPFKFRAYTASN